MDKPEVAMCCGTCKHCDKKITEEPCMDCRWCNNWEEQEAER